MAKILDIARSCPPRRSGLQAVHAGHRVDGLPAYLVDVYAWAYLNPRNVRLLDRDLVVNAILWGNMRRLQRALLSELRPGIGVLQAAHVYGSLTGAMARLLGPRGFLDVIDIAPLQVANCRRKLRGFPQASVRVADAAEPGAARYDVVSCFFLLHELPLDYKRAVVGALLDRVAPGGKAVFVDYHRPSWRHPLKPVMSLVFDLWEPFAKGLWRHEIADLAPRNPSFAWRKETLFGGLYQTVVAVRNPR